VLTAAFDGNADDLEDIDGLLGDGVRLAVTTGDKATAKTLAGQASTLAEGSQVPHRQANALYCRGCSTGTPRPCSPPRGGMPTRAGRFPGPRRSRPPPSARRDRRHGPRAGRVHPGR